MTKRLTDLFNMVLLSQLFIILGAYSLMKWLFSLSLAYAHLSSLTLETWSGLLRQPISILCLLALLFVAMVSIYLELATVLLSFYAILEGKPISLGAIFRHTLHEFTRQFPSKIAYLCLHMLLVVPLLQFGYGSLISDNLRIPAFISGELEKGLTTSLLYYGAILGIAYLNLRLIYTIPLIILSEQGVWACLKESLRLTKGKGALKIWPYPLCLVLVSLILEGLNAFFDFLVGLLPQALSPWSLTLLGLLLTILLLAFSLLWAGPRLFLSYLLFRGVREAGLLDLHMQELPSRWRMSRYIKGLGLPFYSLLLALTAFGSLQSINDLGKTKIMAHRGYVALGVENSLGALEAAKAYGVDYVEMDIQQTVDGHYVVMHDSNLKRLTGQSLSMKTAPYESLYHLPIYADAYQDVLPSFEDYLQKSLEIHQPLNVELKLHGGEDLDKFAADVVSLLHQYQLANSYLVQSLNKTLIEKVEAIDPSIKTGLILPFQFGGLLDSTVDFYVVEESSYNQGLQKNAHSLGKEVYVWTVNQLDQIRSHLLAQTDGIITDALEEVQSVKGQLQAKKTNQNLYALVKAELLASFKR